MYVPPSICTIPTPGGSRKSSQMLKEFERVGTDHLTAMGQILLLSRTQPADTCSQSAFVGFNAARPAS